MAQEDTWSETAYVAITKIDESDVEFCTITETVDLDIGDKDFDVINTLKGGRLVKFNPQEPTSITLEAYPVEAGTATGTTGTGFEDLIHTGDTTQPMSISFDKSRTKIRCVVLWTDDTTATNATDAPTSGSTALRFVLKNGYVTSSKPSFTDGVLKSTVTMKFPAFDKTGTSNGTIESTDGTGDLIAVSAYTSS